MRGAHEVGSAVPTIYAKLDKLTRENKHWDDLKKVGMKLSLLPRPFQTRMESSYTKGFEPNGVAVRGTT